MAKIGYFLSCEEWGPKELIEQAKMAESAGFDEVYVQQIGPEQEGFFHFFEKEVMPRL